jgi:hypothetical protein
MTKLDREWLKGVKEFDQQIVGISLPGDQLLENLKTLLGSYLISDHNLLFFDKLPEGGTPAEYQFVPGRPIKMSVWVNSNSKLAKRKPASDGKQGAILTPDQE